MRFTRIIAGTITAGLVGLVPVAVVGVAVQVQLVGLAAEQVGGVVDPGAREPLRAGHLATAEHGARLRGELGGRAVGCEAFAMRPGMPSWKAIDSSSKVPHEVGSSMFTKKVPPRLPSLAGGK